MRECESNKVIIVVHIAVLGHLRLMLVYIGVELMGKSASGLPEMESFVFEMVMTKESMDGTVCHGMDPSF